MHGGGSSEKCTEKRRERERNRGKIERIVSVLLDVLYLWPKLSLFCSRRGTRTHCMLLNIEISRRFCTMFLF